MSKLGFYISDAITSAGVLIGSKKWLYYMLNYTWGLPMTLIGLIVKLCIRPFTKKILNVFGHKSFCFGIDKTNNGWGLSIGTTTMISSESQNALLKHEFGHTVQNAIFGPLQLFVVYIPSFLRYWYRIFRYKMGKPCKNNYDDIWFEESATKIGSKLYLILSEKDTNGEIR